MSFMSLCLNQKSMSLCLDKRSMSSCLAFVIFVIKKNIKSLAYSYIFSNFAVS